MATKVFQYVKGAAIPSAQSYELWKVRTEEKDGETVVHPITNSPIETQKIKHELEIVGSIGSKGFPDEQSMVMESKGNEVYSPAAGIAPVRDLTDKGYKYYIRFEGHLNIATHFGTSTGVPFQGSVKLWFDSPEVVNGLSVELVFEGKSLYLKANVTDAYYGTDMIKIFNDVGDTSQFISAGIKDITAFGANNNYRRTDPILIDDLTDNILVSTSPLKYACVGPFQDDNSSVDKIIFYDNISLSSWRKGLRYSAFKKAYLSSAELKVLRDDNAPNAKYVVFCSRPGTDGSGEDFVSLGGIYFLLTGNDEINDKDKLAVIAKGDNVFFSDSPFSNAEPYNKIDS